MIPQGWRGWQVFAAAAAERQEASFKLLVADEDISEFAKWTHRTVSSDGVLGGVVGVGGTGKVGDCSRPTGGFALCATDWMSAACQFVGNKSLSQIRNCILGGITTCDEDTTG
jgi:hypothetical protein